MRVISLLLAILCFGLSGVFWWDMDTRKSATGNYCRLLYNADSKDKIPAFSEPQAETEWAKYNRDTERQKNTAALAELNHYILMDQYVILLSFAMGLFFLFRFFRHRRQ